jgi:hypothetical protein
MQRRHPASSVRLRLESKGSISRNPAVARPLTLWIIAALTGTITTLILLVYLPWTADIAMQHAADNPKFPPSSLSPPSRQKGVTTKIDPNKARKPAEKDPDADCPFRNSPLYRKVYVYPDYGRVDQGWSGDILSDAGRNLTSLQPWPWLAWREQSQRDASSHYDIQCQHVQYATELLIRELMIHPNSCLRTTNPEEATLFYVPYLPSVEHHQGSKTKADYSLSPYGRAIEDIIELQDYTAWERWFGLTSKYWKRRQGADHILVFSEPIHGLSHPRNRRGHYHYIRTQKQLKPPIVISVELSTTFVREYPKCSAKNILVPYPNTDGRWYNGFWDKDSKSLLEVHNISVRTSEAAAPAEREWASKVLVGTTTQSSASVDTRDRPAAMFYSAGNHGTCKRIRQSLSEDYRSCSASNAILSGPLRTGQHAHAMRWATFCPCPGGDSPSAKRMFDSILAGCIPIILSHDFVWPFTHEFDASLSLDPATFSLRLDAQDYAESRLDPKSCQLHNASRPSLAQVLQNISTEQLRTWRQGLAHARYLYSWYAQDDPRIPENPLRDNVLPTGGLAHAVVQALAERAEGVKWPACRDELLAEHGPDATRFVC